MALTENQKKFLRDMKHLQEIEADAARLDWNKRPRYISRRAMAECGLIKTTPSERVQPPSYTFWRPISVRRILARYTGKRPFIKRNPDKHYESWTKYCVDCGESFETVNTSRISCDFCHDVRCKFGGYTKILAPDGDDEMAIGNTRTSFRK